MKNTLLFAILLYGLPWAGHAQSQRPTGTQPSIRKNLGSSPLPPNRDSDSGLSVTSESDTPAQDSITRVTFLGPKTGWGVVKTKSPYYSPQGKNLGLLPSGTLFTYSDVKTSSRNPVLVSRINRDGTWQGPFLLDCMRTAAYDGNPGRIAPVIVTNLCSYFTLEGQIVERKAELTRKSAPPNSCEAAVRQALQAYRASIAKADERVKQASALTGMRKVKANEDLRSLKYEQQRLKAALDSAVKSSNTWKDTHPIDPGLFANDPALQTLEKQRATVRAYLGDLIPPSEPPETPCP